MNSFIESSDEGGRIISEGVLQASTGDVIIQSRGDIFIKQVMSAGNLFITTSGNVTISDAFVGGECFINGKVVTLKKAKINGTCQITSMELKIKRELFVSEGTMLSAHSMTQSGKICFLEQGLREKFLISLNKGSIECSQLHLIADTIENKHKFRTQGHCYVK